MLNLLDNFWSKLWIKNQNNYTQTLSFGKLLEFVSLHALTNQPIRFKNNVFKDAMINISTRLGVLIKV